MLYVLDLHICPRKRGSTLQIEAMGGLRIGPQSSNIRVNSTYQIDKGNACLMSLSLCVEGFGVDENYKLSVSEKSYFMNENKNEPIETKGCKKIYDPLLPLLLLKKAPKSLSSSGVVKMLVGKRLRDVQILTTENNLLFCIDNKRRATYFLKNQTLKLFPLGIKIQVQ